MKEVVHFDVIKLSFALLALKRWKNLVLITNPLLTRFQCPI